MVRDAGPASFKTAFSNCSDRAIICSYTLATATASDGGEEAAPFGFLVLSESLQETRSSAALETFDPTVSAKFHQHCPRYEFRNSDASAGSHKDATVKGERHVPATLTIDGSGFRLTAVSHDVRSDLVYPDKCRAGPGHHRGGSHYGIAVGDGDSLPDSDAHPNTGRYAGGR